MKTVVIQTEKKETSRVTCRKNVLGRALPEALAAYKETFIFTDETVLALYGKKVRDVLGDVPVYAMPAGEEHKTPETLLSLLAAMTGAGLHRNACLVCLGGGVVGDIGGLAASLYMRGIACIQVPTTLLSQVDSSVGGKTAVDFMGVKNLVGAFFQPKQVFADPAFFATLPPREIRCGLGEIVKHGALDGDIFDTLQKNRGRLSDLDFLAEIVPANIVFKASVVRSDATERDSESASTSDILRRTRSNCWTENFRTESMCSSAPCLKQSLQRSSQTGMRHILTNCSPSALRFWAACPSFPTQERRRGLRFSIKRTRAREALS